MAEHERDRGGGAQGRKGDARDSGRAEARTRKDASARSASGARSRARGPSRGIRIVFLLLVGCLVLRAAVRVGGKPGGRTHPRAAPEAPAPAAPAREAHALETPATPASDRALASPPDRVAAPATDIAAPPAPPTDGGRTLLAGPSIAVRVLAAEDGRPIAGARAVLVAAGSGLAAGDAHETDAAGACALAAEDGAELLVTAAGRVHARVPLERRSRLEVRLARAAVLAGRVLDAEGNGVSRASVAHDCGHAGCEAAACTSEPGGFYRLEGVPRDASLAPQPFVVRAGGHAPLAALVSVVDQDEIRHDFRLAPGRHLTGIVQEWPSGLPLAGALVELDLARATSGPDGTFALDVGLEPKGSLRARAPGHCAYELPVTSFGSRQLDEPLVIPLVLGATITGVVRDERGGALAHAEVLLLPDRRVQRGASRLAPRGPQELPGTTQGAIAVTTDERGAFRVEGLVPHDPSWVAYAPPAWDARRSIEALPGPGESLQVDLVRPTQER